MFCVWVTTRLRYYQKKDNREDHQQSISSKSDWKGTWDAKQFYDEAECVLLIGVWLVTGVYQLNPKKETFDTPQRSHPLTQHNELNYQVLQHRPDLILQLCGINRGSWRKINLLADWIGWAIIKRADFPVYQTFLQTSVLEP